MMPLEFQTNMVSKNQNWWIFCKYGVWPGFGDTVLNVASGAVTYGIGHGAHDVKIHHQNSKWKQTHTH